MRMRGIAATVGVKIGYFCDRCAASADNP